MTREEAINKLRQMSLPKETMEILEAIAPELHENEDERIINQLITLVNSAGEVLLIPTNKEELVAWLNKCKESLHISESCKENADSFTDEDEKIRIELLKDIPNVFPYEKAFRYIHWLEKQKEQKPSEKQDYSELNDLERAILRGFLCAGVKNVPVGIIKDTASECMGFLALIEPKPAEWSEVELEFRGEKVKVKRPFYRDDKGRGYSTTEQDEDVAWNALRAWCEKKGISLYDLYPKAEWSEEDADILNCCISSIEEAKENRYAYKETDGDTSYDHEIAWLKSLRPQPHWKPSEEQMTAFKGYIEDFQARAEAAVGGWNNFDVMIRLYEQLKKL